MTQVSNEKTCFVIAPIGEEGTETRKRSDQVLQHIITPAVKDCGYSALRADKISEPGIITSQVIQQLLEAPLVVADLTGRNANVFYELAIRHAVRLPIVQIIKAGEAIPFDVSQSRTIQVNHQDLDSAARCRDELVRQIKAVEKNPHEVDSPISAAVDLKSLRQSGNPLEKSVADIISILQDLRVSIAGIAESPHRRRIHPGLIEEFAMYLNELADCLPSTEEKDEGGLRLDDARHMMHSLRRMLERLAMESGLNPRHFAEIFGQRRRRAK